MGEADLPNSVSLEFVEALYADFLRDPQSVPSDWRAYFESFPDGNGSPSSANRRPTFKAWTIFNPPQTGNGAVAEEATTAVLQERIDQLIRNYRVRGQMAAQLDTLGNTRADTPKLELALYGLHHLVLTL